MSLPIRIAPSPGFPADALTPDGDPLATPHRHGTDGFYAVRLAGAEAAAYGIGGMAG